MNFKQLTKLLNETNEKLFHSAVKAVNTSLTIRNWLFGYYIVEFQQNGEDRAVYGEKLLQKLSTKVKIRGVSKTDIRKRNIYINSIIIHIPTSQKSKKKKSKFKKKED